MDIASKLSQAFQFNAKITVLTSTNKRQTQDLEAYRTLSLG